MKTKLWQWILTLFFMVILLGGRLGSIHAAPPTPSTPPSPPTHPPGAWSSAEASGGSSGQVSALSSLKAVLLVGPIDGDYGSWTTQEKQNMELAAVELEANGVTVYRFYPPNNNWQQIKAAADGAHFLFYRGHGVYWTSMPYPTVGGFALKNRFVSADDIRTDLNLAPNAIVMLYGCFTAGSSSIDDPPIHSQEAQRRVAQYSDAFFDIGAAGYYANWFGNAFQMYVRYLFQGMTMGEAYEAFFDFNLTSVERYSHPDHPGTAMWLDKDYWDGRTEYNNAFVGLPDQTLADLFDITAVKLAPAAISYLAEPSSPARSFIIHIDSTSWETFGWTASVSSSGVAWMSVQPLSGVSGDRMTVVITPAGQGLGTQQVDIWIAADDPEVGDGERTIPVTLRVLDHVWGTYLPVLLH